MATTNKNSAANKKKKVISEKNIKEYSSDPFFIQKREAALKLLKKAGIPDSFAKKK